MDMRGDMCGHVCDADKETNAYEHEREQMEASIWPKYLAAPLTGEDHSIIVHFFLYNSSVYDNAHNCLYWSHNAQCT